MKVLTVVIPSYNSELFLDKCLESFLDTNEVEVLVVDDGSTDKTGEIADKYAKDYPEIFRSIHKKNGGHGSVINVGIEEAKGKYFRVLDSDDWFEKNSLKRFVNKLNGLDVDIILNPYVSVNVNTGIKLRKQLQLLPDEYEKISDPGHLVRSDWVGLAMITYNTDFIRSIGVKVDEKTYYDDVEYIQFFLPFAKTAVYMNEFVYQYRTHQANQSCSTAGILKHGQDHQRVLIHSISYYEKNKHKYSSEDIRVCVYYHLIMLIKIQYCIFMANSDSNKSFSDMRKFDEILERHSAELYHSVDGIDSIKDMREVANKDMECQMTFWKKNNEKAISRLGFR